MQLIGSIKKLDVNTLGYIDLTMVVEFRKNSETFSRDVAGCKLRMNQEYSQLQNVQAVDYRTSTGTYEELKTIQLDQSENGQNWSLATVDTFADETEFYCQTSHCYVTCNLKRLIYTDESTAKGYTDESEDALFYQGANLEVLGTYFSYTDVPNQGQLIWSKGKSNDWQKFKVPNGMSRIQTIAASLVLIVLTFEF